MIQLKIYNQESEETISYDFDGKAIVNLNGKNKSTLKLEGIYSLTDSSSREILTFPLYSRCVLMDDNEILFEGIIKEATPIAVSKEYEIKPTKILVYDYKDFLSNGILVSKSFKNVDPIEIIEWLKTEIGPEFNFIEPITFGWEEGTKIQNWGIQDGTAYDILNELALRTNSRFWVNNFDIYFQAWETMVERSTVNLNLTRTATVLTLNVPDLISIEFQDSSSFGYANSIMIKSSNVISAEAQVEVFRVRAGQLEFLTELPVAEIKEAWLFDSATNLWRRLFVRELTWTEDPYNQWFEIRYTQGKTVIEVNPKIDSLKNGQTLYIEYYSLTSSVGIKNNIEEIERVQEESSYSNGRIVYIDQKDDITSQIDLDNYAASLLDKMSIPRQDYTIMTVSDLGWKVSEIIRFDKEEYVVESIDWNHLYIKDNFNILEFTYRLTNTKNDNQTINFYDSRLVSNPESDVIERVTVVDTTLEWIIGQFYETTTIQYPNLIYLNLGETEIKLLNADNEILYQETRVLNDETTYELEVELHGQ